MRPRRKGFPVTPPPFALALTALSLACAGPAAAAPHAPSDALWSPLTIERSSPMRAFAARVAYLQGYTLDAPQLRAGLTSAGPTGVVIALPLPDGTLARVRAVESRVLGDDMQRMLPDFRSFVARGVDDATLTARLDLSQLGFRAMLLTTEGTAYLEPLLPGREDVEASFWARDDASNEAPF